MYDKQVYFFSPVHHHNVSLLVRRYVRGHGSRVPHVPLRFDVRHQGKTVSGKKRHGRGLLIDILLDKIKAFYNDNLVL